MEGLHLPYWLISKSLPCTAGAFFHKHVCICCSDWVKQKLFGNALAGCSSFGAMAAASAWPQKGLLCETWDGHGLIREQLRSKQKLLQWPSPKCTGVANRANLVENRFQVECILKVWIPHTSSPKSPPIEWLRSEVPWCSELFSNVFLKHHGQDCNTMHAPYSLEVKQLHQLLVSKPDSITMYVDEWGCKRLTSMVMRRFRAGSMSFKEPYGNAAHLQCMSHRTQALQTGVLGNMSQFSQARPNFRDPAGLDSSAAHGHPACKMG